MKRTRALLAFFAAVALLALAANAGQTGLGGDAHLAAAAANSSVPALLASVQPSVGPTPCTLPSTCTYGCSAGDATIMRYWAYQEKHVWYKGDINHVSVSVPAATRSRSGLGGGWYLVRRVACSRYGVHGYARIEGLSVSSPSVSVSCSPDCGRIDSITATASGGHISFTVVGTGPYGFGWASQSEVVCIHQNSGGSGGGGGGGGGTATLYVVPRGLPDWLLEELKNNHAGWLIKYYSIGATNSSATYRYGGVNPTGRVRSFDIPVNFTLAHLNITYAPIFKRKSFIHGGCTSHEAGAGASRGAGAAKLWLYARFRAGSPGCRVYAEAVFVLNDSHVGFAEILGVVRESGSFEAYVSNGTGWVRYTGGRVLARMVKLKSYSHEGGRGYVVVTYSVSLMPWMWTLTWNGSGSLPMKNGTLLASTRGSEAAFMLNGSGNYQVQAWFGRANYTPILPGVLLLPNFSAGVHVVSGGFEALLVNGSGGGLKLWYAQLPLNVSVARGFSWRMLRDPRSGHMRVGVHNYTSLPKAYAANTSGHLLALQSPTTLGPARLCIDADCTWYNVTRLILRVQSIGYNGTHLLIRLRPSYECCPTTPLKEHLVYVLQLAGAFFESPPDTPVIAIPYSKAQHLKPVKYRVYARFSIGGPVPLQQPPNITLLYGSAKPLLWDDARGRIVFSRPYVWRADKPFNPQPWNGSPGTLRVYVEEWRQWFTASWNGTNFIVDIGRPTRNLRVVILWLPPSLNDTDTVIIPLIQRW